MAPNASNQGVWQGAPSLSELFKSECDILYSKFMKRCRANDQNTFTYCRLVASIIQNICENRKRQKDWSTINESELARQRSEASNDFGQIMTAYDGLLESEKNIIAIFNNDSTSVYDKLKQSEKEIKSLKKDNPIMSL